ncbi:MAG TPA: ChbG/HpnK family deacetylase [Pseudolabrys sp.]|nr:ChbG/HpnK family deacetylase [Pseudolabrys sp.]
MTAEVRRIWLCADDYGMAPGINRGIRQLILAGRLNATSVMTAAPWLGDGEAAELAAVNAEKPRAALGLHVTLTGPFRPLSAGFAPARNGAFPPQMEMMRLAMLRRVDIAPLTIEIATQLEAFIGIFGRPPDFLDGHQHVHLLPVVRDAFLKVAREGAPNAWVRQCMRPAKARPLRDAKSLVLDLLSVRFRNRAARLGIATNPAFSGAYAFTPAADFAALFPRFLAGMPDGGLIMCHPGYVDPALKSLDSLTDLRERELAYFASEAFPHDLARHRVALMEPAGGMAASA